MKVNLRIFFLSLALFLIDQATKYFAYHLQFGSFLNLLRPVFGKELFPNYNFAFSLHLPTFFIYFCYLLLLALLLVWFAKLERRSAKIKIGFALILVGALSNILDRLMLGYVRDFIFIFWGNIFNFADIYIVAGIILLMF